MFKLTPSKQHGATLVVVLLLLLIIMMLALSIASTTTSRTLMANANVLKSQAYQAAETGSDVLLALLNKDGQLQSAIPLCTERYDNQYHQLGSSSSKISASSSDQRGVTVSWYACRPKGDTPVCGGSDLNSCFAVVITGVACYEGGSITGSAEQKKACTVSRHLQGYGSSN